MLALGRYWDRLDENINNERKLTLTVKKNGLIISQLINFLTQTAAIRPNWSSQIGVKVRQVIDH